MKDAPNSLRVVIDTNIFVSAIVFGGEPRKVINLIAEDSVSLISAQELITELRRVIVSRFPDFLEDLVKAEKLFESGASWIRLGGVTIGASRDPDDDKFIETAVLGKCHYIVSGDKDLLDIKEYKGIKIVSATEFLELFNM